MGARLVSDIAKSPSRDSAMSFTRWWIENYAGWGEFHSIPLGDAPHPCPHRSRDELLAEMNAKLCKGDARATDRRH